MWCTWDKEKIFDISGIGTHEPWITNAQPTKLASQTGAGHLFLSFYLRHNSNMFLESFWTRFPINETAVSAKFKTGAAWAFICLRRGFPKAVTWLAHGRNLTSSCPCISIATSRKFQDVIRIKWVKLFMTMWTCHEYQLVQYLLTLAMLYNLVP